MRTDIVATKRLIDEKIEAEQREANRAAIRAASRGLSPQLQRIEAKFASLDASMSGAATDEMESPSTTTSEDAIAHQFAEIYGGELRYVPEWGRWLRWDGRVWQHDKTVSVIDLARGVCRDAATAVANSDAKDSQIARIKQRLGSAQTVWAVVRLAGTDPRIATAVEQLDADPWKLNTPGGVLCLKTGALEPHQAVGLHTKITAAAPTGDCPQWHRLLARVIPEAPVRDYLQRLAGYALTGSSREHVLPFAYGTGRNGKGTVFHTLRSVLGDYGLEIPAETLMETHNDRHLTEIAVLRGARFVVGSEVDSGRRWNESRLKRLTGGDPIAARYIAKDMFEFEPSHTLVIVGNHKPGLRAIDEAMRARMHLIDFAVTIPEAERDTELPEKLKAEYGGILRWALVGCLDWQDGGLRPPESIKAATDAYLTAEDSIASWVAECCEQRGQITLKAAHHSYREWCEENAQAALGRNTFADQLEARGFQRSVNGRNKSPVFAGLELANLESTRWSD